MERSVERAAKNELTFRRANQEIDRRRAALPVRTARTPYICECEQPECTDILLLSAREYAAARSSPRRFVLSPGHETGEDVVVVQGPGFITIEKTGREGDLVARRQPADLI
jgi:hypothetical protein